MNFAKDAFVLGACFGGGLFVAETAARVAYKAVLLIAKRLL